MWSQYHKNKFRKLRFLSCLGSKTASAGCVPAHLLGHYWWKQSFHVFGTGCDRLSARLETAKNVLPYPSRHILSKHPHSHPSEWVARGHRGRQNRQHSKNGWKVHKLRQKHLFGSKLKKTKRFMIFDPKKGRVMFSIFLTPPHPPPRPPPLPQNLKKVGFKWGGSGGGSGAKTHWGIRLLDKIMILQGVKLIIQPLGVECANMPKKAQNGGYVVFSPIYAYLVGTRDPRHGLGGPYTRIKVFRTHTHTAPPPPEPPHCPPSKKGVPGCAGVTGLKIQKNIFGPKMMILQAVRR